MADSFVPMSQWLLNKARELDEPEPGDDLEDLRETKEAIRELVQWVKAGRLATLTRDEQGQWARQSGRCRARDSFGR